MINKYLILITKLISIFGSVIIRIVSVVGKKNTGKTLLTVKIIQELKKRDFKVATIKHSHHKMEMDRKDTDTWKHKEAGSDMVVGAGDRTFFNIANDLPLERILFLIKVIEEPDFVVVEGFKNYKYSKISTSRELEDEFTLKTVDAFNIDGNEVKSLVDIIEKNSYDIIDTLYTNECDYIDGESIGKAIVNNEINYDSEDTDVYLSINEKVIGLNYFVNNFIKHSIIGMLKSLKTKEYGINKNNGFEKIELIINDKNNK
ncbi:MAG: molybdopterin-guanine dinucleotide biosynthesis protein B [Methanobacteriaceae archaeon]|jgi:molybdopterin-guanine dinucleotide biosynthesis protein B|nr:molybdopterin-guanine dinucleotide biosynthesis protein B [Candidatus Methanorudis spinitermitis]